MNRDETKVPVIEGALRPCDVDDDGVWTLPNGDKVDLHYLEITLPEDLGKEKASMVMMDLTGFVDECPLCGEEPTNGFAIFLQEHYYLGLRCCNTLLLYENENNEQEKWI